MQEASMSESSVIRDSRPENVLPGGQPGLKRGSKGRVESTKLRVGQTSETWGKQRRLAKVWVSQVAGILSSLVSGIKCWANFLEAKNGNLESFVLSKHEESLESYLNHVVKGGSIFAVNHF